MPMRQLPQRVLPEGERFAGMTSTPAACGPSPPDTHSPHGSPYVRIRVEEGGPWLAGRVPLLDSHVAVDDGLGNPDCQAARWREATTACSSEAPSSSCRYLPPHLSFMSTMIVHTTCERPREGLPSGPCVRSTMLQAPGRPPRLSERPGAPPLPSARRREPSHRARGKESSMRWSRDSKSQWLWLRTLVVLGLVVAIVAESPLRAVGGIPAWLTRTGRARLPGACHRPRVRPTRRSRPSRPSARATSKAIDTDKSDQKAQEKRQAQRGQDQAPRRGQGQAPRTRATASTRGTGSETRPSGTRARGTSRSPQERKGKDKKSPERRDAAMAALMSPPLPRH